MSWLDQEMQEEFKVREEKQVDRRKKKNTKWKKNWQRDGTRAGSKTAPDQIYLHQKTNGICAHVHTLCVLDLRCTMQRYTMIYYIVFP